jgi:2-keto-3-deoxy-6-phosphogluconate aldolase
MLPLYFNADETVTIEILRAIYRAGIKAVEYTSRGESALSNFTKMVAVRNVDARFIIRYWHHKKPATSPRIFRC